MAYTELSAILKRTIFCTFVHQGDKKLHHLTGEDRKLPDECRRKQIVKVVTRWFQHSEKSSYLQFLPKISSRVYSVNSRKLSEAKICTQSKIKVTSEVKFLWCPNCMLQKGWVCRVKIMKPSSGAVSKCINNILHMI